MNFCKGLAFLTLAMMVYLAAPKVAHGQVLVSMLLGDKVSSEKFHLGLNIGLNGSSLSGFEGTKLRTGFNMGVIGEWRFTRNWYLQPEVRGHTGGDGRSPSGWHGMTPSGRETSGHFPVSRFENPIDLTPAAGIR